MAAVPGFAAQSPQLTQHLPRRTDGSSLHANRGGGPPFREQAEGRLAVRTVPVAHERITRGDAGDVHEGDAHPEARVGGLDDGVGDEGVPRAPGMHPVEAEDAAKVAGGGVR